MKTNTGCSVSPRGVPLAAWPCLRRVALSGRRGARLVELRLVTVQIVSGLPVGVATIVYRTFSPHPPPHPSPSPTRRHQRPCCMPPALNSPAIRSVALPALPLFAGFFPARLGNGRSQCTANCNRRRPESRSPAPARRAAYLPGVRAGDSGDPLVIGDGLVTDW